MGRHVPGGDEIFGGVRQVVLFVITLPLADEAAGFGESSEPFSGQVSCFFFKLDFAMTNHLIGRLGLRMGRIKPFL